jgi:hypothetical protein
MLNSRPGEACKSATFKQKSKKQVRLRMGLALEKDKKEFILWAFHK